MPVLTINGINFGSYMAAIGDPRSKRRSIGDETIATDGTNRLTRFARKHDLSFKTVPLSLDDAAAIEAFIIGEGEVWDFESSLYGSKGTGPSSSTGATLVGSAAKFGSSKLNLAATTGTISWANVARNMFGKASNWIVSVWRSTDSGATWTRYVVNSAGQKWVDAVRNDAASTTWLTVSAFGSVTLANTTGSAVQYDDLVVLPFLPPVDWAPQFQSTSAWPPNPYLDVAGDFVREQSTRRMSGQTEESFFRVAGGTKSVLAIELTAR